MSKFKKKLNALSLEKQLYFLKEEPIHLGESEQLDRLERILGLFDFIEAKLDVTDPQTLIADYDLLTEISDLRLVQGALRLSADILAQDPTQLAGQLLGRLMTIEEPRIQTLMDQARSMRIVPWLRPLTPSLTAPGGSLLSMMTGHNGYVNTVAVLPGGQRAITGSSDGTLKVWDLEAGIELYTVDLQPDMVYVVAALSGSRVIFGSHFGRLTIRDLDLKTEKRLTDLLTGSAGSIDALAVFAEGRQVIFARGKAVVVADLDTPKVLQTFEDNNHVNSVAVFADGRRAIIGSGKAIKVWNLENGDEPITLIGHNDRVNAVAVLPDGQIISASDDQTLKVWNPETQAETITLKGHNGRVSAVAVVPGGRVISASYDRTLKVWDLETGVEVCSLLGHTTAVMAVSVAADGKRAISASWDGTLMLWDLDATQKLHARPAYSGPVYSVKVFANGQNALSGSNDGTLKVWDLRTGQVLRTLDCERDNSLSDSKDIYTVALSPNDQIAISGSADGNLKLWDIKTGHTVRTWKGHNGPVWAVAMFADGQLAVSASDEKYLRVWDLQSGTEIFILEGHRGAIRALTVLTGEQRVISGSDDYTFKIWDLHTRQELKTLRGYMPIHVVTLSPNEQLAITGGTVPRAELPRHIRLGQSTVDELLDLYALKAWDLENWEELYSLKGHTSWVSGVTFFNGERLASISADHSIKVWDLEARQVIASFSFDSSPESCSVAPDGITIIVGDNAGRLHKFRLEECNTSVN